MFKVIFMSISTTLLVVVFIASIFLNSILGVFGLASTSIETLNNLHDSKQIVDKVKTKHKAKKLKISKYAKRTSRRISASAISAATIGTAAVVVAVVGFEVVDYCDDKEDLHEFENILFKTDKEYDYGECLSEAKNDTKAIIESVKNAVPKAVNSTWNGTKDISQESWNSTKSMTIRAWKATKSISNDAWGSTTETTDKFWDSLIDIAD